MPRPQLAPISFCLIAVAACSPAPTGTVDVASLQTAAERTGFVETTRYDEVVEMMRALDEASDRMTLTTFGYSYEGRALPMMVVGDVAGTDPESVQASGKTRVWIQGNIHAGEVCGKEAMLMMLRSLALGEHPEWSDSLVLLVAPIYNADGNERVRVDNRGGQNGPIAGMGQRPNAQGYDLNRDHMKLDSPEARSLVQMMNQYDPHVLVDLHTTNGTRHAYHVTYSPPLHPNTYDRIDEVLRGDWLPALTSAIKEKHGWDYYYYGNAGFGGGGRGGRRGGRAGDAPGGGRGGGPAGARAGGARPAEPRASAQVWRTFDHRPRFNNNYVGLRNRFAILSEAYAYATFEDRVMASLWFVEETLDYADANAGMIQEVVAEADQHSVVGEQMAVRAAPKISEEQVEILMGEVEQELNPYSGRTMLRRLDVSRPVMMREAGEFEASTSEIAPLAYFLLPNETEAIDKLRLHGIAVEPLGEDRTLQVERFVITESTAVAREFQGHNERTLEGSWTTTPATLPADTWVVRLDQPLGRLAFYLLEPRSDDGLTNWNFFDRSLERSSAVHPAIRIHQEYR